MRSRFLLVVAVSLAFVALLGGVAFADTAADNAQCLTCHGPGTPSTAAEVDFGVGTVDRATACNKCHWITDHPYHFAESQCGGTCHKAWFKPTRTTFYQSVVPVAGSYFSTAASYDASAETLHTIHTERTWIAEATEYQPACATCHAAASCDACHDAAVGHGQHGVAGDPAVGDPTVPVTTNTAPGVAPGTVDFVNRSVTGENACAASACHNAPEAHERIDDTDAAITYTGAWSTVDNGQYLGGSITATTVTGAALEATFEGTGFSWIGAREINGGIAEVYVDGTLVATVDTYTAPRGLGRTVYWTGGLPAGTHTLRIVNTGTKNPSSTGNKVSIQVLDFRADGAFEAVPSCSGCHFTFDEHYDETAHASTTLIGCGGVGCHATPDLLAVHTQNNATFGCGGCHDSVRVAVQDAIAAGDTACATCHSDVTDTTGHYSVHWAEPPLFRIDPVTHIKTNYYSYWTGSAGTMPTGDCSMCHTSNLVDEHLGRFDTISGAIIFPAERDAAGNALTCGTCHNSTASNVSGAISSGVSKCEACHTVHGPINAVHASSFVDNPAVPCADCHDANLVDEHNGSYTSSAGLTGCDVCHDLYAGQMSGTVSGTVVQDAIAVGNDLRCTACHPSYHTDSAAHEASSAASLECGTCHAVGQTVIDVTSIHPTCATCHQAARLGEISDHSAECSSCHAAEGDDYHRNMAVHNAPESGCSVTGCHHANRDVTVVHEAGCTTCHDGSALPATTACDNCHVTVVEDYHYDFDVDHTPTDAYSTGCAECHDTTDVRSLHVTQSCDQCHFIDGCNDCHSVHMGGVGLAKSAGCGTCHSTAGTDYHTAMSVGHTFTGMGESCKSCHDQTLPEAHADYLDRYPGYADTCALCHKNADPDRINWDTASADCSTCHEIHGDVEVLHTSTASQGCVRCHDSADVRLVHAATPGDADTSCDVCHNATFELTADMTAECETCHNASGVPFHTAMNVRHIGLGTSGTCEGSACHVPDVAALHEEYIGVGTQYPQYEDSCALCHLNEDANRIDWSVATNGTCYNCHGWPHDEMNHVASSTESQDCAGCHNTWVPDTHKANPPSNGTFDNCNTCHRNPLAGNLTWDKTTSDCEGCHDKYPSATNHYPTAKHLAVHTDVCVDCHYMDLKSEHVKVDVTCVECHTDPSDSAIIAAGWNMNCDQCHMDSHHDKVARHASTRTDCSTSGCHESDVSAIHSGLPWMGCKSCHTGPGQLASDLTKNCTDSGCHDDGYHTTLPGLHTATASQACTRCHSEALPDGSQLEPIHDALCATCHNTTINASTKTAECTTCHNTTVSPYHAAMDDSHTFTAMNDGCQMAGCHTDTLPEEHAKYLSRYPSYTDTCALCHLNADPGRIDWATASADCMTCHDGHGDLDGVHTAAASQACAACHETQNALDVHLKDDGSGETDCALCHNAPAGRIDWDPATVSMECTYCHGNYTQIDPAHYPVPAHDASAESACGQCHYKDMKAEHFLGTVSPVVTCVSCHELKVDAFTAPWDKTCGSCHPTKHGAKNQKHVSTTSTCGGVSCHNVADVSDIHKGLSGGGCGACHVSPAARATTTTCTAAGCHANVGTNHHEAHSAAAVNPSGCKGCHFMYLDDEHAALGLTCATCHDSTDSAVVAAIAAGDLRCKSCHPTMHQQQDYEFNPNMAGGHRVSADLPAMSTAFKVNGATYTWTLPATSTFLKTGWTTSSIVPCDGCHTYSGATGPHGSTMKVNIDPAYPTSWKTAYLGGTTSGILCYKCHTNVTNSNSVHSEGDHHDSSNGKCIACHIQVPHGWGRPRLLGTTSDPAPYASTKLYALQLKSYTPNAWSESNCYAGCEDHESRVSVAWPSTGTTPITTGTITGTVRNAANSAVVAGAVVTVGSKTATTSSTGVYTIADVPAGAQTVAITATGFTPWSGTATVTAGGTVTLNASLAALPGSVAGTVTKTGGAAVAGATVSIAGQTATTAANGTYSITGITAGTYTMTVSATGYSNWSGSVVITAGGAATQNVTLTVASTATNLARNGTSSASSQYSSSYSAAKATDGSTSTYWRSSSTGTQWLRSDLGSAKTITSVVVNWNSSYYARSYRIETSNDGTNWTQQFSTSSGNGSIDTIPISSVSARYVRVYCTSSNGSSYRVTEFEVWGY